MGVFVDLKTGERLPLSDAVEAGLVKAEYENGQYENGGRTETKTYAVNSVVDQVHTCCFVISLSSRLCSTRRLSFCLSVCLPLSNFA